MPSLGTRVFLVSTGGRIVRNGAVKSPDSPHLARVVGAILMTGSASLRGWLLLGLIFCGIGLERLLNSHLVGPLASDFSMRLSIGLICTVAGLAVIVVWLWKR
jgi:hypothetical protein